MSKDIFHEAFLAVGNSPQKLNKIFKDQEELGQAKHYCNYENVNSVINSGIFNEGGLKGKSIQGEILNYKTYPIKSPVYFILQTTSLIIKKEKEEIFQESIYDFDTAINKIEGLKCVAEFYRSWVSYKKLDKIINELTDIKSNLLNKANPNKLHFRIAKTWWQEPDRIDELIQLFEEQVPEAPRFTIGRAIHKLLSKFGILSTEPAITQRIYRKRLSK
jgi:hypothetical protein